jgi:hypothetical protein
MQDDEQTVVQTTHVVSLGRLTDDRWPGGVSADNIFVDVDKISESLNEYYVAAHPDAPSRCIDGRHDPALNESSLGAQVPGGAPGAALAFRLGVDKDDLTRGTFFNDAETMVEAYIRLGLSPGGHRDDNDHGDGVGCGAIDGIESILQCMTDPTLVEDHKRLVKSILDTDFNRDNYLRVLGAGLVLRSRSNDYFAGRSKILDVLEERAPGSVSVLEGTHQEVLFIVNMIPDTTLASNRFSSDNNGMQAFGYDLWRSKQLSMLLFPLPSQQVDRDRFVMARVMITVATLMALTDGSLRCLVRTQDQDAVAPEQ